MVKKAHRASFNRRRAAGAIFLVQSAVQLKYGKFGKKIYVTFFYANKSFKQTFKDL